MDIDTKEKMLKWLEEGIRVRKEIIERSNQDVINLQKEIILFDIMRDELNDRQEKERS